jgi:hypothetical protein
MFWRIIGALVVMFWAVMAGLLVRDAYFPGESVFASVPPRRVLDLFLDHRSLLSTLHLFKEKEKIGHASFTVDVTDTLEDVPRLYELQGSGMIEGRALPESGTGNIAWQLALKLANGEKPEAMTLRVNMDAAKVAVLVEWKAGEARPFFEVRRDGEVIADATTVAAMMPMLAGSLGNASAQTTQIQVNAREGLIELAGRERKGYELTLGMAGASVIRAVFTQAGELARVDLPQGYRLLEPSVHGIETEGGKVTAP